MRKIFLLAAATAATSLFAVSLANIRSQSLGGRSPSDDSTSAEAVEAIKQPRKDYDDPLLAEIVDIRGQTSGDLLQGTLLASTTAGEDDADFSAALRTVIEERQRVARTLQTLESADQPPTDQPSLLAAPAGAISRGDSQSAVPAVFETLSLADALRQAARELDQSAADLDDRRQFERADSLRELSQSLRDHWRRLAD